jgi:hypothetical protein
VVRKYLMLEYDVVVRVECEVGKVCMCAVKGCCKLNNMSVGAAVGGCPGVGDLVG